MGKKTIGKKGYKWEENKMEEANASKEVEDCTAALAMSEEEVGVKFSNGDKKKKRHDDSGNDVECSADGLNMGAGDGVKLSNGDKKKKRHDMENSYDALPTSAEEDGVKLRDGDKKKKKKKRHDVSGNDVEVGASQSEAIAEGDVHVSNSEKENDQRKKRKAEFNKDEKEPHKARKKDKRVNDDGEVSETLTGVEENVSLRKNELKDLGNNVGLEARKDKKKSHKENRNKDGTETISSMIDVLGDNRMEKEVNRQNNRMEKEENAKMNNGKEGDLKKKKKKKKKRKRDKEGGDVVEMNSIIDGKEVGKEREQLDGKILENVEDSRKKRKRDKKKCSDELKAVLQEMNNSSGIVDKEFVDNEGNAHLPRNEAGGKKVDVDAVNMGDGNKDKKKEKKKKEKEKKKKKKEKVKALKEGSKGKGHKGVSRTADPSEKPTSRGRSKKVSFSDHVEVFTSSDGPSDEKNIKEDGLVHGKRFSQEEDEKIKEAVANYIEVHGLGGEGLDMVLNCRSHPEIKHCWKEIGAALPWRPTVSIYYRGHIIFQRSEERKWTPEELKLLKDHYEKNGADWKSLADVLGKHRFHVKDAWRRTKLSNMKNGHWSQDEYQNLFDLVNVDLRMKAFEEKKSKHGMLRDNICWGAISDKLATRNNSTCCVKWYNQLQSPMVAEGIWADVDDYRLLNELYNLDACCIEDVDWDYLLEHRSGDVCRKRWNQMVRHIGDNGKKSFAEQVEVLSKRYCPDILEAREAYDSKPAVP